MNDQAEHNLHGDTGWIYRYLVMERDEDSRHVCDDIPLHFRAEALYVRKVKKSEMAERAKPAITLAFPTSNSEHRG